MYFVEIGLGTHPCKNSQKGSQPQAGYVDLKKRDEYCGLIRGTQIASFNCICPQDRW